MLDQAQQFFQATGCLAALLYKEEIELLLRTPGFAGFSLLDLHDYPSQGTALVGLLDPFWDSKGFVAPAEHKRYCGPVVPLLRIDKRTFTTDESLSGTAEVANFGPADIKAAKPQWQIADARGSEIAAGALPRAMCPRARWLRSASSPRRWRKRPHPANLRSLFRSQARSSPTVGIFGFIPPGRRRGHRRTFSSHALGMRRPKRRSPPARKFSSSWERRAKNTLPGSFLPVFWSPVWFPSQIPNTVGNAVQSETSAICPVSDRVSHQLAMVRPVEPFSGPDSRWHAGLFPAAGPGHRQFRPQP